MAFDVSERAQSVTVSGQTHRQAVYTIMFQHHHGGSADFTADNGRVIVCMCVGNTWNGKTMADLFFGWKL